MLAAIAIWFVPMWLATSAGGELLAYRNELLFHQTVTRYADAWHHRRTRLVLPRQRDPAALAAADRAACRGCGRAGGARWRGRDTFDGRAARVGR